MSIINPICSIDPLRPQLNWMCSLLLCTVLEYAQWLVLEPIMTVEVAAPVEFQGTVLGGLTKRHAVVTGQDATEGYFSILCEVVAVVMVVAEQFC